jgi:addiction module RelE/StbE family toxin
MDVYKVTVTNSAKRDLRGIARYISTQLNAPTAALNTVRTIKEAIANLKTNALLHPFVRDDRLAAKGYRPLVVKNYIAFYVVTEKDKLVEVDRVMHSRRDWRSIL